MATSRAYQLDRLVIKSTIIRYESNPDVQDNEISKRQQQTSPMTKHGKNG